MSVSGTTTGDGPMRVLTQSCPGTSTTNLAVTVRGDELVLGFDPTSFGGINITPRYTFRRAP